MTQARLPAINALLHIPQLRVQNANAISGPHSWGHPGPTAFTGLMAALRRKLGPALELDIVGVGIINHHYQAQTNGDYVQRFNLSRNPLNKDGSTAAIVEEGRIHLELSLVFGLVLGETLASASQTELDQLASTIHQLLHTLRVAGGSILPGRSRLRPKLTHLPEKPEEQQRQFRQMRRWLMPGYALVARDDLLPPQTQPGEAADDSRLDAWLDQCRLNHYPVTDEQGQATWQHSRQQGHGWIVPLPVGYGALSPLYPPGSVAHCRDETTPVCFVESLYSLGEWLSPHRLTDYRQLLWYPSHDASSGVYRCHNDYHTTRPTEPAILGELA